MTDFHTPRSLRAKTTLKALQTPGAHLKKADLAFLRTVAPLASEKGAYGLAQGTIAMLMGDIEIAEVERLERRMQHLGILKKIRTYNGVAMYRISIDRILKVPPRGDGTRATLEPWLQKVKELGLDLFSLDEIADQTGLEKTRAAYTLAGIALKNSGYASKRARRGKRIVTVYYRPEGAEGTEQ